VTLHLFSVPADADTEEETPVGQLVEGGDLLGGDDGIALSDQRYAGAEQQCARESGSGGQRQEGV